MDNQVYILFFCILAIVSTIDIIINSSNNLKKFRLFYTLINLLIIIYLCLSRSENEFFKYFAFIIALSYSGTIEIKKHLCKKSK